MRTQKMNKKSEKAFRFYQSYGVWQLLRRTARVLEKIRERELVSLLGITGDAAAVLFTVARQENNASPSSIARELLLEPHSVSEQLARMQKEGLIRKVRDTNIKNRVQIRLTEKGRNIFVIASDRRSTRKLMSVLTKKELELMWDLLARLRDNALKQLRMEIDDAYPPSDPKKLSQSLTSVRRVALDKTSQSQGTPKKRKAPSSNG